MEVTAANPKKRPLDGPDLDDLFGAEKTSAMHVGSTDPVLDDLFGTVADGAGTISMLQEVPVELFGSVLSFIQRHSDACFEDLKRPGSGLIDAELSSALKSSLVAARQRSWITAKETAAAANKIVLRELEHAGWPHVCWREAHGFLSLVAAVSELALKDLPSAMRHVDFGIILGLPSNQASVAQLIAYLSPRVQGASQWLEKCDGENDNCIVAPSQTDLVTSGEICAGRSSPATAIRRLGIKEFLEDSSFGRVNSLKGRQPAVLDGFSHEWPAMRRWRDLSYWEKRFGHRTVPLELGKLPLVTMAATNAPENVARLEEKALSMREFVATYLRPSLQLGLWARLPGINKRKNIPVLPTVAYLAQHELFNQISELREDFDPTPLSRWNEDAGALLTPSSVNAWVGTGGTVTPLHFDADDNILAQIAGLKLVRLYDPSQTACLYVESGPGAGRYGAQGNLSLVDVEEPDFETHPRMRDAVFTEHILRPGEALFIPSGTWHYVRSLTTSVSVNFFFA